MSETRKLDKRSPSFAEHFSHLEGSLFSPTDNCNTGDHILPIRRAVPHSNSLVFIGCLIKLERATPYCASLKSLEVLA